MKITIFTGNQPRHIALVNKLASISSVTYAVLECTTAMPGFVQDFYNKSEIMQKYFLKVLAAEKKIFDDVTFSKSNAKILAIKSGDLSFLTKNQLGESLCSDLYIVFGASFIKGWLAEFLISKKTINIHMGISPYYRGNSCNFWALYDNKPEYVGATIHLLSKGLDSGAMLYHAIPRIGNKTPFEFTMMAVQAAQTSLVERILNNQIFDFIPYPQDNSLELRYSKNIEFTDSVAAEYLSRNITNEVLSTLLSNTKAPLFLLPYYLD